MIREPDAQTRISTGHPRRRFQEQELFRSAAQEQLLPNLLGNRYAPAARKDPAAVGPGLAKRPLIQHLMRGAGHLVRREDETESLAYFWVRFDGEPTPFEAGQYMTIGVMVDGRIVQRPYSVASPPAAVGTDKRALLIPARCRRP